MSRREILRAKLGFLPIGDHPCADNLAVVLCDYFESHPDRPKDDPATDNGWGEWVEKSANDALDSITQAALEQQS